MKLRRDSIIFKIVSYNGIAIVISAVFTALMVIFITFSEIDKRFTANVTEKTILLGKGYEAVLKAIRSDVLQTGRILTLTNFLKDDKTTDYQLLAETIKEDLDRKNFKTYYDTVVSIVSKEGDVLGEAGSKKNIEMLSADRSKNLSKNLKRRDSSLVESYSDSYRNEVYTRVIIPFIFNSYRRYIVVTLPINSVLLQELKNFIGLGPRDRIFLLASDRYSSGDLSYPVGKALLPTSVYDELKLREYRYYDKKMTINKLPYTIGLFNVKGYNNEMIGSFGIAVSRVSMEATYFITIVLITILVIFFIFISTTTFKKIMEKLLTPLQTIDDAANGISSGSYGTEIPIEGDGEFKTLSISFNKMLKEINSSHEKLKNKNEQLTESLIKIEAIERILMGMHIEDDIFSGVKSLLGAFTSEVGLGFGRAMFFRYSREADILLGEDTSVNNRVTENSNFTSENSKGFKFQIEELEDLVKLIKVPLKDENLLTDSLREKRVVFYNDKGYKHNLGNDLFNGLGLNNFVIFPIFGRKRNYGVIVADYFTMDREITKQDFELLNLLLMNIFVRVKNKAQEEEKIDQERIYAMEKIIERILQGREDLLERLLDIVERGKTKDIDVTAELMNLQKDLLRVKERNAVLRSYSVSTENVLQEICLENFMEDVIKKYRNKKKNPEVQISLFSNATIKIFGNPSKLERAFIELFDNAFNAVMKSRRKTKKINVILTKEKNIDKVKINIKDNGIGMTQSQLNTIYNPFVSYSDEGPGLGLSFVYSVINDHGGVIKFFSGPDQGTDVKITLNIYKEEC